MKDIYKENTLSYPAQRDKNDLILDFEKYKSLYPEMKNKVVGEIGTGYLYHYEHCIPLIQATLGKDVKILIILRNPANRCYSSYMHFTKDLHETATFEEAINMESGRKKAGWDFMWMHKELGFYSAQVDAYSKAFKNCKVLIYEEFVKDPKGAMIDIFAFLGLQPKHDLVVEKVFNPSGNPKNRALQKFITHENPLKKLIRPFFRLMFSKEKREKIRKEAKAKNLTKGQKLPPEQLRKLMSIYMSDILKLEEILGRDLKIWYENP